MDILESLHPCTDNDAEAVNLCDELQLKIAQGEVLINSLNDVMHIRGANKLQKRVKQEITFLQKMFNQNCAKEEHVKCSNLGHLESHVNIVMKNQDRCLSILENFKLEIAQGEERRVCVDIVADDGQTWIKVIARNAKALSILSCGNSGYGKRTVRDQAVEFVECAKQNPHHFKVPKVLFVFAGGVDVFLAKTLESINIEVQGERIITDTYQNYGESDSEEEIDVNLRNFGENVSLQHQNVQDTGMLHTSSELGERLNLDVTAMIAYVSSLTNDSGCQAQFQDPFLTQQAEWERQKPAKPLLDKIFEGKRLFCCCTAHQNFCNILQTVGGPSEKERAAQLLKRITVVPDQMSERTGLYLKESGKISPRSRIIFGSGDHLQAVTVTANNGFVRSAVSQGLTYAVIFHEWRALTEMKALPRKSETPT